MTKFIQAVPKFLFDRCLTKREMMKNEDSCYISILDPDNVNLIHGKSSKNFLVVNFWDIERDFFNAEGELLYEKPPINQLLKIVKFVNKFQHRDQFIIHCSAGVSRSGAVAMFIKLKFEGAVDELQFMRVNPHILPNIYVMKKLLELDETYKKRKRRTKA